VITCVLGCTCAVAVFHQEEATRCFSNDLVSLVQGGVQIHRHEVQWPSIGSIIKTAGEVIVDNSEVLQSATNTIIIDPFVKAMGAFDTSLKNLDETVQDLWSKANESADDLAKTTDKYITITINGVTDSAAVNTALSNAVLTIEQVTSEWSDLIGGLDSVVKILWNDLSIVGFKDVAKTTSEKWDAAIAPLQQISETLLKVKQDLQRGSQPWISNVDTDKLLQEALDMLDQVSSGFAEKKTQLVLDWFQLVADTVDEQAKLSLLGDRASEIPEMIDDIPGFANKMLDDLAGGLSAWVAKFEEELRKIKAITAKAVAAEARSSA